MEQYTMEDLKKVFLIELKYQMFCRDDEEVEYYKKIIDSLVNDFYDISKKEVFYFSERDTFILRKLFGILDNGVCQESETISKIINLSSSRIIHIKHEAFRNLGLKLLNYNITAFDNDNNSNLVLSDSIQKLNLSFYEFRKLHRYGIKTIEDLISLGEFKLKDLIFHNEEIIDTIYKHGFSFKKELSEEDLSFSVDNLKLSVKTYNCLMRAGINTIAKLISMDKNSLSKIKNMNIDSFNEIINRLHFYGLSLSENDSIKNINLFTSIDNLELSVRTYNCLKRCGINTIADLIYSDKDYLSNICNINSNGIDEIIYRLHIFGLSLSETDITKLSQQKNDLIQFEQSPQTSEQIIILEKYKNLLLQKKELQYNLNKLDSEINTFLEQIDINKLNKKNR